MASAVNEYSNVNKSDFYVIVKDFDIDNNAEEETIGIHKMKKWLHKINFI